MGFFTGLTLTSLVQILNAPAPFPVRLGPLSGGQYFAAITTFVALGGALSSGAMLAFLEIAGGMAPVFSFVDRLGTTLFFLSVFGFLGVLPLLRVAFTPTGAVAVLVLEVALLVVYFVGRRTAAPPPASA